MQFLRLPAALTAMALAVTVAASLGWFYLHNAWDLPGIAALRFGSAPARRVGRTGLSTDRHILRPESATALAERFEEMNYTLERVRTGQAPVPRVYLSALPPDLVAVEDIEARKSLFIRGVLPLVLKENERLLALNRRLRELRSSLERGGVLDGTLDGSPDGAGREWLAAIFARFRVRDGNLDELIRRADAVPASLALAQAATESAWGTSRFVHEGNALFGQWTWSRKARGMVPAARRTGATYRVRSFPSLMEGVQAYMRTLNTHWAYADFRMRRATLREAGKWLDGPTLAGGMRMYSERRHAYIADLRSLIRANRLHVFDGVELTANLPGEGPPLDTPLLASVDAIAATLAALLPVQSHLPDQGPGR